MFGPAFLEVCCVAVMAPALTQAVRQADGPNLLLSHRNLDFLPCKIEHTYPSDRSVVPACPAKLARTPAAGSLPSEDHKNPVQNGQPWDIFKSCNGNKSPVKNHVHQSNGELEKDVTVSVAPLIKPVCNVNGHSRETVGVSSPTSNFCDLDCKMNEEDNTTERMGLLNTNATVDCDFQSKVTLNHPCALPLPSSPSVSPSRSEQTKDIPEKRPVEGMLSSPGSPKSVSGESTSTVTAQNVPVVTFSELEEVKTSHQKNYLRARDLLLRLRQLQSSQLARHTVGQLESVVRHYQKSLSIPCQRQLRPSLQRRLKDTSELKAEFLQNEDVRNLSTAALVNLVRKIESSNSPGHSMHSSKSALSHVEETLSNSRVSVKLNTTDCEQLKQVSGSLLMRLKHTQAAADPDVTESSSGGESCDELDGYDEKRSYTVPLHKRAMWKWVQDRAAIAKRWVWIQTQVSDIEYKVRQITDLLAQAHVAKGIVSLEDVNETLETLPSETAAALEQAVSFKKSLRSVNGYLDPTSIIGDGTFHAVPNIPLNSEASLDDSAHNRSLATSSLDFEDCGSSSRTRPLKLDVFRRRKLLRTAGLHMISRKAARLSTVKCNCNSRVDALPCILCGGRYNNMQSVSPNLMPLQERIALLQPSYHPVLSFEQDVHFSLHFENVLKRNDTYCNVSKSGPSPAKKMHFSEQSRGVSDHRSHRHNKKLTRHAAQALLTSARYRSRNHSRNSVIRLKSWKKASRKHSRNWSTASSCSSRPESPEHNLGGLEDGTLSGHDSSHKRRDGSQFDIDNIVIPYNIKTTNFEKPQYKEIITPKWRYIEVDETLFEDSEDVEDISEETIQKRYDRLEIEEKKHLRCGSTIVANRRGRRNFRYDSRAGSSGANTPDNLSFYNQDMFQDSNSMVSSGHMSPVISPPATPYSLAAMSDDSQPSCSTTPAACSERRRTTSFTKREKLVEETTTGTQGQDDDSIHYPPFERRTFPLADEEHQRILDEVLKLKETEIAEEEEEQLEDALKDHEFSPMREVSSPESHKTTSSTSSAVEEDDVADPEWTVVKKHNGCERTLVLTLAKNK